MVEKKVNEVYCELVNSKKFNELSVEQVFALRNLITKYAEEKMYLRNKERIEKKRKEDDEWRRDYQEFLNTYF